MVPGAAPEVPAGVGELLGSQRGAGGSLLCQPVALWLIHAPVCAQAPQRHPRRGRSQRDGAVSPQAPGVPAESPEGEGGGEPAGSGVGAGGEEQDCRAAAADTRSPTGLAGKKKRDPHNPPSLGSPAAGPRCWLGWQMAAPGLTPSLYQRPHQEPPAAGTIRGVAQEVSGSFPACWVGRVCGSRAGDGGSCDAVSCPQRWRRWRKALWGVQRRLFPVQALGQEQRELLMTIREPQ